MCVNIRLTNFCFPKICCKKCFDCQFKIPCTTNKCESKQSTTRSCHLPSSPSAPKFECIRRNGLACTVSDSQPPETVGPW